MPAHLSRRVVVLGDRVERDDPAQFAGQQIEELALIAMGPNGFRHPDERLIARRQGCVCHNPQR